MAQPLSIGQSNPYGPSWRPSVVLALLLTYFALFGVMVGYQGVLWAELKPALQLSDGTFGSALLVSPLVALGLLLQGGRLCVRVAKKPLAVLALALLALSMPALANASGLWGFVAALALAGAGSGLLEVVMNATTLDWELATGRAVMNVMHAGFSGGAVLGALGGGALLTLGWSYGQVLGLLTLLCGLALAATLPAGYPPVDAGSGASGGPAMTMRLLFRRRAMVVLGLVCLLGVAAESVANNWLVLYLGELNTPVALGGAAFALFNGAMFVGRLANAPLVSRLGPRISLLASGVGLVVAALLLVPAQPMLAVGAFVVLGLAVAGVVPTVLVAARRLLPGDSGAVAGGMMAAGYAGFVLCPPLVGWLAELFASLHLATLLCVGVSSLGMLVLVRSVPGGRAARGESR